MLDVRGNLECLADWQATQARRWRPAAIDCSPRSRSARMGVLLSKRLPWFRLHADVLNNPKVQRLDGDVFKGWINLLCLARENDGNLPSEGDMAFALRQGIPEVRALLSMLESAKLLDRVTERLRPHDWDEHQQPSDNSAERMRKFRYKKREASPPKRHSDGDVTSQEPSQDRHCDVSVTRNCSALDKNRGEQNRAEQNCDVTSLPVTESGKWKVDIDRFRDAYPKVLGGKDVNELISHVRTPDDEAMVYRHLALYIPTWSTDPTYIMNAKTWFYEGFWKIPPKNGTAPQPTRYIPLED